MNSETDILPKKNILVVDDKPDNLRLLSTMLTEQGYDVRKVVNGQMALKTVKAMPPDLILLDINMPDLNGFDVCTYLKADEETRDIPVIFISAVDEVLDKVKAFNVGGVDYITKPFQLEEVLARVENHLTRCRLQRQLQEQNELLQAEVKSRMAVEQALQKQNEILQEEINSRIAVEKTLQEQNVLFQTEIKERRKTELALQKSYQEIARSNAELEQFAYVASHDLQAPLGIIYSYAQLLGRRYKNQLDAKAENFIQQIVVSSVRMQKLIDDLLEYSRIGQNKKAFEITDCNEVIQEAISNLQIPIQENQAVITYSDLPSVIADSSQLVQLFQNFIDNAIKYRRQEPPTIHISVQRKDSEWLFAFQDNGIGIEAKYLDRIFQIFQRLHTPEEYPGTGIGLAVCHKIIEHHGGRIWVESQLGQGSIFCCTIPDAELKTERLNLKH